MAVLAVGTGSLVWLFQDELFHPFGDARACEGSATKLPQVISAGGVPIPADASDIHYVTKNGNAQVSFLSSQVPDYLHRSGLVPEDVSLFDGTYGSAYALGLDDGELPEGLCGSALTGPAWSYYRTGPDRGVNILVEQSSIGYKDFRAPARVIATFDYHWIPGIPPGNSFVPRGHGSQSADALGTSFPFQIALSSSS